MERIPRNFLALLGFELLRFTVTSLSLPLSFSSRFSSLSGISLVFALHFELCSLRFRCGFTAAPPVDDRRRLRTDCAYSGVRFDRTLLSFICSRFYFVLFGFYCGSASGDDERVCVCFGPFGE